MSTLNNLKIDAIGVVDEVKGVMVNSNAKRNVGELNVNLRVRNQLTFLYRLGT